ncbi:MAG: HEAT repeat domain-containing protein [Phycisphaerales bacterium]|nr:HEAT repeat domain-containing protein [Phycisphaerales bacterium]
MPIFETLRGAVVLLAATFAIVGPASAAWPPTSPATVQRAGEQHLDDFVHYALTANIDLAKANAEWLLKNVKTDEGLATLLGQSTVTPRRFERALRWAMEVPELSETASDLANRIEQGRLSLSRDQERVAASIAMLDGTRRDQMLAQGRLVAAGEYAVPALLREMIDGDNEERRWASAQLLREIGRESVTPLVVALPNIAPEHQRRVTEILGSIGYNHAGPALLELSMHTDTPAFVRESAAKAYRRLGGNPEVDQPAMLYTVLSQQYFDGAEHLVADPYGDVNNIWEYDSFAGLTTTQVPTELYGPIMSMRSAGRAIQYDRNNSAAVAQFIASNLRRENMMPDDYVDPIFGDLEYSPQFYATIYGSSTGQDVLVLAIDSRDTPLVRDSLEALGKTTGEGTLFSEYLDRQPLLEALQYPDRRVQYDSALILARALPRSAFAGSYRVVPTLASAVRTGGDEYAVVIADSREDQRAAADRLEALGFTVVGTGSSADELVDPISRSPGIDLAVIRKANMKMDDQNMAELRRNPKTSATPILMIVSAGDMPKFTSAYRTDPLVGVSRFGVSDSAFAASVESLMERGVGGRLSQIDAEIYAMEALGALREIALARPGAYAIGDSESALIDALAERTGGSRLLVAEILSLIESERAQQALLDAALAEDVGADRVPLLDRASSSVRRWGNRSHRRHVEELRYLIDHSSGEVADAAARTHGAMNLPPQESITIVIPGE